MYRSVLQQTAPLPVVAAQWSAGGAACKEEDLGRQASVGGGLWKQVEDLGHHQVSVGGRLWKPSVGGGGLWTLGHQYLEGFGSLQIAEGGDFGGSH